MKEGGSFTSLEWISIDIYERVCHLEGRRIFHELGDDRGRSDDPIRRIHETRRTHEFDFEVRPNGGLEPGFSLWKRNRRRKGVSYP